MVQISFQKPVFTPKRRLWFTLVIPETTQNKSHMFAHTGSNLMPHKSTKTL